MVNINDTFTGSVYLDSMQRVKTKPFYTAVKRAFDFLSSAAALTILSPLFLLVAIIIKLDSKGPVIFCQDRVGQNGNTFKVYKFRTMKVTAPHETASSELDDPYAHITRVGKLLRKTSVDELPQFINVLKGDMSLIGPRPLIKSEADIHKLRMREGVYDIRPGMTGWAQINGRDCISVEEKVYFDRQYLIKRSVALDIFILFRTVTVVFFGQGYVEGRMN